MIGRVFNKISPALWSSARFLSLSDKGKIVFIYLCSNAHVTSAGCYVLPDGYACTDLCWDAETYRAARSEVIEAGMIDFDPDHSVVWIDLWFKHNPTTNDKHALGTTRLLADIPSDRLRIKAQDALNEIEAVRLARKTRAIDVEREVNAVARNARFPREPTERLSQTPFLRGQSSR